MSINFLGTLDLAVDEGSVGVIEDTKMDRYYVVEVMRFETLDDAETYAADLIKDREEIDALFATRH